MENDILVRKLQQKNDERTGKTLDENDDDENDEDEDEDDYLGETDDDDDDDDYLDEDDEKTSAAWVEANPVAACERLLSMHDVDHPPSISPDLRTFQPTLHPATPWLNVLSSLLVRCTAT